jgi:hypothetical protein
MLVMKIGALESALLLSIGCAAENARPPLPATPDTPTASSSVPDTSRPMTWSDTIQAIEVAEIRKAGGNVSRSRSELRIALLDGHTAVFKDDTTPGSRFSLPRYAGYLKAIRSHVVHRLPYEGDGIYLVINDSTGDSTIVDAMPVPSPDGRRFALTSMEGEAGYDRGLIEVWKIVAGRPEREFSYDTESEPWEPSDAVWRDSVTIDFMKNSHSDPSKPYVQTPARLTRNGTTWVLGDHE